MRLNFTVTATPILPGLAAGGTGAPGQQIILKGLARRRHGRTLAAQRPILTQTLAALKTLQRQRCGAANSKATTGEENAKPVLVKMTF